MREIKFRAWDGKDNEMVSDSEAKFYLSQELENVVDYIHYMQFTGRKDKNGKEIYEGDIVRRTATYFDFDKPDGEEEYYKEEVSTIEYRHNGFWVKDEGFGWEGESLWDWEKMEVVGNIYETPELLNRITKSTSERGK